MSKVSLPCLLPTLSSEKGVNTAERETHPLSLFSDLLLENNHSVPAPSIKKWSVLHVPGFGHGVKKWVEVEGDVGQQKL